MQEYGYKTIKQERSNGIGGGLLVLHKPELKLKKLFFNASTEYKTFEYVCCTMPWRKTVLKIVNLYRLPYSNKHPVTGNMFLDEFEVFLSDLFQYSVVDIQ